MQEGWQVGQVSEGAQGTGDQRQCYPVDEKGDSCRQKELQDKGPGQTELQGEKNKRLAWLGQLPGRLGLE